MAVTLTFFNPFFTNTLQGNIDWDANTFKMALTTSSYSPDFDAHDNFDDVTNEVTGTGYTAGGTTIAGITITEDDTNDRTLLDFDDPEWTTSTITARRGVLYKSTGTASTSPLVCDINFGADFSSSATTFRIELDANGLFALQQQ